MEDDGSVSPTMVGKADERLQQGESPIVLDSMPQDLIPVKVHAMNVCAPASKL